MPSARPSTFQTTSSGALRVYDTEELLRLPPPTWLIDGIIPTNAFIGLYGPPGAGKTFVAADMALCVASGLPWQGKAVQKGYVAYVSAEGTSGLGQRCRAWMTANGVADPRMLSIGWIIESMALSVGSESLDILFQRFEELDTEPSLVVIDTLARCFEGDENQQKDMNAFVAGVDRIRTGLNCTVMVVHHTNAEGGRERGNSVFRASTNTMIQVAPGLLGAPMVKNDGMPSPLKGLFGLTCNRQKDAPDFLPGQGKLVPQPGTTSCAPVIEWMEEGDPNV